MTEQSPQHRPNTPTRQKAYSVVRDKTGLGAWFRFQWRFIYIASCTFGPASRQGTLDPRKQLQKERAVKLLQGYRNTGQQPPAELLAFTGH
ncbi:hypothetical protein [Citricoccus muralis]|uniref:Uncharacterized protein n=1 Tax=Citricoccus muralis TaxID=169134 RepID=A0A3D9LFN6_9MICC|nr:hypothetical protein [Citricoccus muralis]REE04476.1 hypothetical protein C8E99_2312 [Citricoccus muralis]